MPLNWKRLLLIFGFIAIVIVLGYLIYYFFFRPVAAPPPVNVNVNVAPGRLPPAVNIGVPPPVGVVPPAVPTVPPTAPAVPGAVTPNVFSTASPTGYTMVAPLVTETTSASTLAVNGKNLIFYNQSQGKFYTSDPSGVTTLLSDQAFYNVQKITWAPSRDRTIMEFPDGSKIFYNFKTKEQFSLPQQWKDFSFSPTGNQIAFKNMNANVENRWITTAKPDGSGQQWIEHLGTEDANVLISWSPNDQVVALYREAIDASRSKVYFIGLHGENFQAATVEGRDLRATWSPDGKRLLYSVFNVNSDYKPALWAMNAVGDTIGTRRMDFKINTWADKCAFANNSTVYCAVPQYLDQGSGYFPEMANSTPDYIYKLNLDTGEKSFVANPLGDFTVSNLTVSSDESILYFTEKSTGKIFEIKLK